LAITYNTWGLTVNLSADAAVVTHSTAASRIGTLHVLCKSSPWLQAWLDVLASSTGRSPAKWPHPALFAHYSHIHHVSTA
jgi:hypothetical protein